MYIGDYYASLVAQNHPNIVSMVGPSFVPRTFRREVQDFIVQCNYRKREGPLCGQCDMVLFNAWFNSTSDLYETEIFYDCI